MKMQLEHLSLLELRIVSKHLRNFSFCNINTWATFQRRPRLRRDFFVEIMKARNLIDKKRQAVLYRYIKMMVEFKMDDQKLQLIDFATLVIQYLALLRLQI